MVIAVANILTGAGSILDIYPSSRGLRINPEDIWMHVSDEDLLAADWNRVGGDIAKAMGRVGQGVHEHEQAPEEAEEVTRP